MSSWWEGMLDEARKRVALERPAAPVKGHATTGNGQAPREVVIPVYRPEDVATIDDLVRAGADVRWLWDGWIPLGVLTAVAGLAGIGKTRFAADIIRRIRHGMPWPDGKPASAHPDSLALWVVADNHHDQLVGLAQSFDIKDSLRINAPRTEPYAGVTLETIDDYCELEARVKAIRPAMVIVDTVGNATDLNLSRQEDAKAFYWPLQILARKYACAVLCLTHLNASGQFLGRRVLEKVRVAIRLQQPDGQPNGQERLRIEVPKSFGKKPAAIGATMHDTGFDYDDHPPEMPSEPGAGKGGLPQKLKEAVEWLRGYLADGPKRVSATRDHAGMKGYPAGTLYRAKALLDVTEYELEGFKWWQLTSTEAPFE